MSNENKTTTYYFFNYWFKSVTKGMVFFNIKKQRPS